MPGYGSDDEPEPLPKTAGLSIWLSYDWRSQAIHFPV